MQLNKIELNGCERKLLNKIICLSNGSAKNGWVTTEQLHKQPEFENYYFDSLVKQGLVEIGQSHSNPTHIANDLARPTEDGRHYNDWHFQHLKDFLMRSVLTPIVVSAITTLFTLWVHSLVN